MATGSATACSCHDGALCDTGFRLAMQMTVNHVTWQLEGTQEAWEACDDAREQWNQHLDPEAVDGN